MGIFNRKRTGAAPEPSGVSAADARGASVPAEGGPEDLSDFVIESRGRAFTEDGVPFEAWVAVCRSEPWLQNVSGSREQAERWARDTAAKLQEGTLPRRILHAGGQTSSAGAWLVGELAERGVELGWSFDADKSYYAAGGDLLFTDSGADGWTSSTGRPAGRVLEEQPAVVMALRLASSLASTLNVTPVGRGSTFEFDEFVDSLTALGLDGPLREAVERLAAYHHADLVYRRALSDLGAASMEGDLAVANDPSLAGTVEKCCAEIATAVRASDERAALARSAADAATSQLEAAMPEYAVKAAGFAANERRLRESKALLASISDRASTARGAAVDGRDI